MRSLMLFHCMLELVTAFSGHSRRSATPQRQVLRYSYTPGSLRRSRGGAVVLASNSEGDKSSVHEVDSPDAGAEGSSGGDNNSNTTSDDDEDAVLEAQAQEWIKGDPKRQAWWDEMKQKKQRMRQRQSERMREVSSSTSALLTSLENIEAVTGLELTQAGDAPGAPPAITASGWFVVVAAALAPLWLAWQLSSALQAALHLASGSETSSLL